MIVIPFYLAYFYKNLIMWRALKEFMPDVGSSSSKSDGSAINSTPIAVSLRSPPEINLFGSRLPINVSAA